MQQSQDDSPTSRINARPLLRFSGLLCAVVISAFGLIIHKEKNGLFSSTESRLELVSRALEQRTSIAMAYVRADLDSLAERLDSTDINPTSSSVQRNREQIFGTASHANPWMRSTSIVDRAGTVISSSNPQSVGMRADVSAWGKLPLPGQPAQLGPLLSGRDIADLKPMGPDSRLPPVLPMLRSHVLAGGEAVYLVTLINLDHFSNQFNLLVSDSGMQVAMLSYAGAFLTGTSDVDVPSAQRLQDLPIFSDFLPQLENGHYQGRGVLLEQALVAFRSVRDVPLIVVAQRPRNLVLQDLWPIVAMMGGSCAAIVALIFSFTFYARRNIRLQNQSQRELEDALALSTQSKALYQAIQSSALDAIIIVDAHDAVITFNTAAEQIFGHKESDVLGQTIADLIIPPELREDHRRGVQHFMKTGKSGIINRRRETAGQRSDGSQFPMEISVAGVQVANTSYFIVTIRDISATKNDEAERTNLLLKSESLARDLGVKNQELAAAQLRELEIGSQIQQNMLVSTDVDLAAGLWLASFNHASKGIDGDFIALIRVGTDAIDLLAGDVMGKGVPAALLGAATKLQFNQSMVALLLAADRESGPPQPKSIVSHVSRVMGPQLQALDAFVTLVYIRIDLAKNTVTWVGCGHEEALVLSATGPAHSLENQHPPMGVLLTEEFEQSECHFGATDSLFLTSDGATDALTLQGQRLGRELVNACIQKQIGIHQTPSMALHTLRRNLLTRDITLTDDLTLVLMTRQAPNRDVVRLQTPINLKSLVSVRNFIAERSMVLGLPEELAGPVMVAVVEVVTNVIRHAQGLLPDAPMEIIGEIDDGGLTVECRYLGDNFSPPEEISRTDFANLPEDAIASLPEGGFGLSIIREVADEVRYLQEDGVNTVRLRFSEPRTN